MVLVVPNVFLIQTNLFKEIDKHLFIAKSKSKGVSFVFFCLFTSRQRFFVSIELFVWRDSKCVINLMDGARLRQKRICKCFIKNIGDILAYVRKRNTTQGETFKTFYTLPSIYACTEGDLTCVFLKTETIIIKICPANTLVNCITQSFLFVNTILNVSEWFHFLIISENISCSA